MPKKDGKGPISTSTGPRDGRGSNSGGRGQTEKGTGTGAKTGGRKGV